MSKYDVTVIGSGPGGYVAAIRCAQLGFKTAIIEKYNTLGGTCLNVGCIPSKALLDSSEHYHNSTHNFKEHGIDIAGEIKVNLEQMIARKDAVVEQTTGGINFLMDKNKIEVIHGFGSFVDKNTIKVTGDDGEKTIETDKVIIATGSKPNYFPGMEPDKDRIITSTEALKLKEVPKRLLVIGGGVIGLELGSVYARLGAEVEVIEFMDSIIPTMDKALGKELQKVLKKEGFKFNYNHKVKNVENTGSGVKVTADNKKGEEVTFEGDYCLVSVGRKPYTDKLNLEAVGIKLDDKGRIDVNDHLKTSVDNIYAIGDVVKGAMLAHKAEDEGVVLAEQIAGIKGHINYDAIPGIVYTSPEIASVGKTEEELKDAGIAYKVGKFPFSANGRARAMNATDGFVKILADKKTDKVLGGHIVGIDGGHLISEIATVIEFGGTAEDIALTCHAHPTLSEVVKEAALAVDGRPLHM